MSNGLTLTERRNSIPVDIGGVILGGNAPVVVQSMTKTDTADVTATVDFEGPKIAERIELKLTEALKTSETDPKALALEVTEDVLSAVGEEIDRIEEAIRAEVPQAVHLDIEAD